MLVTLLSSCNKTEKTLQGKGNKIFLESKTVREIRANVEKQEWRSLASQTWKCSPKIRNDCNLAETERDGTWKFRLASQEKSIISIGSGALGPFPSGCLVGPSVEDVLVDAAGTFPHSTTGPAPVTEAWLSEVGSLNSEWAGALALGSEGGGAPDSEGGGAPDSDEDKSHGSEGGAPDSDVGGGAPDSTAMWCNQKFSQWGHLINSK